MKWFYRKGKINIFAIFFLFSTGCEKQTFKWNEQDDHRWTYLQVKKGISRLNLIKSDKTGIKFKNQISDDLIASNRALLSGSGVALGDIDGDGLTDIYFCKTDGSNTLYRNRGGWKFDDITEESGVSCANQFSTGAVFADIDGDKDLDLLVTALGGPNALFYNDGKGHFEEAGKEAGFYGQTGATSLAIADIDQDGDLDIYRTNYKTVMAKDIYTPLERSFHQIVVEKAGSHRIREKFIEHYKVEIRGKQVLCLEMAEEDEILINNGKGVFKRESITDGRFIFNSSHTDVKDWGLMARFQDIDLDGDPDLYVCNDFESPDRFYINDGTGIFKVVSPLTIRSSSNSSMAIDFSDLERDGDLDFYIADMLSVRHDRRKTQMGTMIPTPLSIGTIDNRPQYMRNTLFLNRGDQTYAEIAHYAGLQASEWTWSLLFIDIDLDGYEDVLASTGHAFDVMDSDTDFMIQSRTRARMIDFTQSTMFLYPSLETKNFF